VKVIMIQINPSMGESFPLFPLAMLAGLCMQIALQRYDTQLKLVDHNTMARISGTSLDFLIVGAIASVDVYSLGTCSLLVGACTRGCYCITQLLPLSQLTCGSIARISGAIDQAAQRTLLRPGAAGAAEFMVIGHDEPSAA
jgi:hypothetical protein